MPRPVHFADQPAHHRDAAGGNRRLCDGSHGADAGALARPAELAHAGDGAGAREDARNADGRPLQQGRAGPVRTAPKGFMQEIVNKFNLRSVFETEEVRDRLKMAGLRGQAPLVGLHVLPRGMPFIIACIALLYLFVIADYDYPALVKIGLAVGAGYIGFYLPEHVRRQHDPAPPDLDHARLPRRARPAADLRAVGHVDRGRVPAVAGEIGSPVDRAGRGAVADHRRAVLPARPPPGLREPGQAHRHPGVKAVATALIQAERYGTPWARRCASWPRRTARCAWPEAEKKAAALPAKLTVPMIIFFLPVLFVVILGPALIQVFGYN